MLVLVTQNNEFDHQFTRPFYLHSSQIVYSKYLLSSKPTFQSNVGSTDTFTIIHCKLFPLLHCFRLAKVYTHISVYKSASLNWDHTFVKSSLHPANPRIYQVLKIPSTRAMLKKPLAKKWSSSQVTKWVVRNHFFEICHVSLIFWQTNSSQNKKFTIFSTNWNY